MTFLIDLWHDLREKRLWPVAVGMLAAIVAIPAVMFKPASDATEPPQGGARPALGPQLPAVAVDGSPTHGSKLASFSERDPFKPLASLKADASGPTPSPTATGSASAFGGGPTPTHSGSPDASIATGSNPAGSGSGSSGGSGAGGGGGGGSRVTHSTTYFHYTVNLRFGTPDKMASHRGVTNLTMLPDEHTPVVVFMGVSQDAKEALFFIADPGFQAQGEGECNSDVDCRFVKLSTDDGHDEEAFVSLDNKVEYDLQLTGIQRTTTDAPQAQSGDGKADPSSLPAQRKATAARVRAARRHDKTDGLAPALIQFADFSSSKR